MKILESIASGLAGACALTLLHEVTRRFVPAAPRADILGKRAIEKLMRASGQEPPPPQQLHNLALVGDMASNSLYYSLVGAAGGKYTGLLGLLLGALAGIGAVTLPGPLGLGQGPSVRTPVTAAMTIGLYLIGGVVAGAALKLLKRAASLTG